MPVDQQPMRTTPRTHPDGFKSQVTMAWVSSAWSQRSREAFPCRLVRRCCGRTVDLSLEHKCSMPGPLGKQSAVGPHSCAYPMGIAWVPVPINLPSEPISICRTQPAKDSSSAGCPAATTTGVSLTNRQAQFDCSQIPPDMLGTHPVIVATKPRAAPSHHDLRLEANRKGARRCRLLINRHSLFPSNVNRKTNAIGLGVTFDRS
ncbi:hypothetical protein PGT21_023966 [Puccinia graminis f. sp. tritici]|uniref:Uncharacterized protein n=1 Tax=Puccinia graminis f. sp. tritici TaxID=56615 RepID=A0A5B0QUZ9_PUCGR|nr:hypothetical protein PGT21_023966 [Puccinia graminis f. sp. tritici]KAA1117118.1 hypothetical protein PGTUg99_036027 [Puccinia graminis f. sp. tritici]